MTALDPVIHAEARLTITATLAAIPSGDRLTYVRLRELTGLTDGNLASHLRKLEDAGYVDVEKGFRGRTPVTTIQLTRVGRRAFEDYMDALRRLLPPNAG